MICFVGNGRCLASGHLVFLGFCLQSASTWLNFVLVINPMVVNRIVILLCMLERDCDCSLWFFDVSTGRGAYLCGSTMARRCQLHCSLRCGPSSLVADISGSAYTNTLQYTGHCGRLAMSCSPPGLTISELSRYCMTWRAKSYPGQNAANPQAVRSFSSLIAHIGVSRDAVHIVHICEDISST